MKPNGFTLVELITVIILLGILSAITLPRFFDQDTFSNSFNRSQFENALSWTRNRAVTSYCAHEVRLTSTGWQVLRDANCSTQLNEPGCTAGQTLNFSVSVADGSGASLSADQPSTTSLRRLLFMPTGQLYVLTSAPVSAGCTTYPAVSDSSADIMLLPAATLSWDEATAYVSVQ